MIHVNIALDKDDEWRIFAGNDRREQSDRLNAENVHDYIEMMDNARNDLFEPGTAFYRGCRTGR